MGVSDITCAILDIKICTPIEAQLSILHTTLVGWLEFNIPFQHKYGYIRDELHTQ